MKVWRDGGPLPTVGSSRVNTTHRDQPVGAGLYQDLTKESWGIWRHSCTIRRGGILKLKWNGDPYMRDPFDLLFMKVIQDLSPTYIYIDGHIFLFITQRAPLASLWPLRPPTWILVDEPFSFSFFFRRASLFHWLNCTATCSVAMTVL